MQSSLQVPRAPTDIVISDEFGVVERFHFSRPPSPLAEEQSMIDRDLNRWVIKELMEKNKELQDQLAATKKKWYVITAGIITTFVPLAVCTIELYNSVHDCD